MKEHRMCKNDIILMFFIFILSFLGFIVLYHNIDNHGGILSVLVNGEEVGRYDLAEDQIIPINERKNVAEIKDGKVYMIKAECPDQICVYHKPIFRRGEQIVCLPNQVILQIQEGEAAEFDGITN